MSIATTSAARQRRSFWERASLALMVLALGALIYLVARIALSLSAGEFALAAAPVSGWSIALAALIYMGGHGFRVLRLGLLIGGWRVGLRAIATFHLMTAAVGLTAPLKLGELYRVIELANLAGGLVRAVLIAWWERVFDIAVILLILAIAIAATPAAAHVAFYAVAAFAMAFVLLTAIVFFVAPDNLRRLAVLVIRRYDSPRSVPLLRALHTTREAIQEAPWLVKNKLPSLITLTALIWTCELACFAILFPAMSSSFAAALEGLLSFLSALTLGETLLGVLDGRTGEPLHYFAATQAPLALVGLVAGAAYAAMRWKRGSR